MNDLGGYDDHVLDLGEIEAGIAAIRDPARARQLRQALRRLQFHRDAFRLRFAEEERRLADEEEALRGAVRRDLEAQAVDFDGVDERAGDEFPVRRVDL